MAPATLRERCKAPQSAAELSASALGTYILRVFKLGRVDSMNKDESMVYMHINNL